MSAAEALERYLSHAGRGNTGRITTMLVFYLLGESFDLHALFTVGKPPAQRLRLQGPRASRGIACMSAA